ncbi:MAG: hypothetical protein F6J93_02940 [Oscillatoria sp. SIO1A7]|nr:hypothetical protein [Oscillatoria sp. SIO1A7]
MEYEGWRKRDLAKECQSRGIKTTVRRYGKKKELRIFELVELLKKDDAAKLVAKKYGITKEEQLALKVFLEDCLSVDGELSIEDSSPVADEKALHREFDTVQSVALMLSLTKKGFLEEIGDEKGYMESFLKVELIDRELAKFLEIPYDDPSNVPSSALSSVPTDVVSEALLANDATTTQPELPDEQSVAIASSTVLSKQDIVDEVIAQLDEEFEYETAIKLDPKQADSELDTDEQLIASEVDTVPEPEFDTADILTQTDAEMHRLGWDALCGRSILKERYEVASRRLLSPSQLLDFLHFLQEQPDEKEEEERGSGRIHPIELSKADLSLEEKIAMSTPMFNVKVLTLRRPWAFAIAQLGKNVENRTWPTKYRGPLLIHAGAASDNDAEKWIKKNFGIDLRDLPQPRSQIIAVANLVDCVLDSDSPWAFPGQWHWILENICPCVDDSIGAKGKQGIWNFSVPEWWADKYDIRQYR